MADDSALTDLVRRAAQANARLYKGWMDLSLEYMRAMSEIFGGATSPTRSTPTEEMDAGASTLVLEGEAGSAATGSFLVSNDLDRPISCKLTHSDFADPTGVPAKVRAAFDPASLELAPGEQRVVKVTFAINEGLVPGAGYAGEIAIAGMDGFAVPVVLRRLHVAEDSLDGDEVVAAEPNQDAPSKQSTPKGASAQRSAKSTGKATRATRTKKAR